MRTTGMASWCVMAVAAGALCVGGMETQGEKARPDWDYDYDVVDGDVQVERTRDGKGLGATPLTSRAQLFPVGRPVNYFVAYPINSNDRRISAAVRDWESKTCIRFNKCWSEASCPRPYIRFTQGQGCSSPIGRRGQGVNSVSIARNCDLGATVHEIGHSLGLSHEQNRKDRDSFVRIDRSQIHRGMEYNFNKIGRNGRDMGKYDYGSIMHYGAYGFAIGRRPVITAPAPIGQRRGLSAGDVAAIDFMYNGCSTSFARPRCLASVDAAVTHTVQPSRTFAVDFNAVYDPSRSMRVSYGGTTAPSGQMRFMMRDGTALRDTGVAEVQFFPTYAMAGQTYTLSATFTGSGGSTATCSVRVRVAGNGPAPGPAPRPVPVPVPVPGPRPSPPTGGRCQLVSIGFNTAEELRSAGSHVAVSTRTKRWGVGSMMIRWAHRTSTFNVGSMQPSRFSVYTRVESGDAQLRMRLYAPGGQAVNVLHAVHSVAYFNTFDGRSWSAWGGNRAQVVRRSTFQNVVVAFDWRNRRFSLSVDGMSVGSGNLPHGYAAVSRVEFYVGHVAPVYVDGMQLQC